MSRESESKESGKQMKNKKTGKENREKEVKPGFKESRNESDYITFKKIC